MPAQAETDHVCPAPIAEHARQTFLPRLFGPWLTIIGENAVYTFMSQLCQAYTGGFWQFYETDEGALYMAPEGYTTLKMSWDGNGFEGQVSAEAAGIIATLFALSHMSMAYQAAEGFADRYHALLDFASEHPEAGLIFSAID